jgi:hypothetical protein
MAQELPPIFAHRADRPTCTHAAIDQQVNSAHQPRRVAGKVQRRLSDIVHRSNTLQRLVSRQDDIGYGRFRDVDRVVGLVGIRAAALAEDVGRDWSRRNGVQS